MNKVIGGIVTVLGLLLLLPLIGVDQLAGTITNWLTALGVLAIGIMKLIQQ